MPQTKKKPTTNNFWKNFQKWMESLQAQGGMTGADFPAPAPPSVSYPTYGGPTGYRSQGGQAWGWTPQPQPTGAPKTVASMPPVQYNPPPVSAPPGASVGGAGGTGFNYYYTPGLYNPPASIEQGGFGGGGSGQPASSGYGWRSNPNLVWQSPYGNYYASRYGQRALGLSDLNIDRTTGELTGAYNRYGQPLGTSAPVGTTMQRQAGKYYFDARTPEENLWYNRMYGKPGVAVQSLQDKRAKMRGPANEGTTQKSKGGPITSTSGTGWQNALINWRY